MPKFNNQKLKICGLNIFYITIVFVFNNISLVSDPCWMRYSKATRGVDIECDKSY